METEIKCNRIYKYEDNETTKEEGRVIIAKGIINLYNVSDYEEYKGDLTKKEKRPMTLILTEYSLTSEWRVFLIDFEDFHKIMTDFKAWIERQEGKIKLN